MINVIAEVERRGGNEENIAKLLLSIVEEEYAIKNASIWIYEVEEWRCLYPNNPPRELFIKTEQYSIGKNNFIAESDYIFYHNEVFLFICKKTSATPVTKLKKYLEKEEKWLFLLGHYLLKGKKESLFNLFKEAAHYITTSLRDEDFLDVIIQTAIDSLPSADAGFLFLYDDKLKKLLVKSAVGFKRESYLKTRLAPGEGISGEVFKTGQPIKLYGKDNIREAMENMSSENLSHYINATIISDYPNAVLSTPLICDGEIIGVLTLDGFNESAKFYQEDLEILMVLSDYIAVAINHYKLYHKELKTKRELELTHKALRKEHEQLQRTTDLYNELTTIATQNNGLEKMLHSIYEKSEAPVVLYDILLKPLYSAGPKHFQPILPEDFLKKKEIQYCIKNKKWQTVELDNQVLLLVVPVIASESVIGFLCAWLNHEMRSESNRLLLELGTTMLALELTKEMSVRETKRRMSGNLINQLIADKIDKQTLEQVENLGIKENDYYTVLICEAKKQNQVNLPGYEKEIWISWIEHIIEELQMDGIVTFHHESVLALVSVSSDEKKEQSRKKVKLLANKLEEIDRDIFIGIGRAYNNFLKLNKSYREALQCLKLLRRSGKGKVLHYAQSGVYGFLLDHDEAELKYFIDDILGPLITYEEQKNSDLLKTLLLYVEYDRDLSQLVTELNIHHNTLYYRISRIEEILGVSFKDYESWFNIQLACKIYQFIQE